MIGKMNVKSCIIYVIVLIHIITAEEVGDGCVPNEHVSDGVCTLVPNCDIAVREIRTKNYHSFSRCGFQGDFEVVCCPKTVDKFGNNDQSRTRQRIADVECKKIVASTIPPLGLYIIGGEEAALGEFPHMVALGFNRQDGYKFDCGGSLVSNRYVLTAAHCVDTLDQVQPEIVRMGVVELGNAHFNRDTDVRVESVIKHPEYTRREKYHDLALLKLEKDVEFTSNLNAACLYTDSQDPTTQLTVTGWGTISTTRDTRSNILLKANVTVVTRSQCSESYTNWRKLPVGISARQICAGDPEGRRDTCQGDSGGPLQGLTAPDGHYRLVGVTSFGRGCGSVIPGVYTRLSQYLDWIEAQVWPR